MNPTRAELKITVAKLIETAYSTDKGLTAKIVRSKGPFKLAVDQDGKATLSGSAGVLTFSGDPALKAIGARVKWVSITFANGEGNLIKYSATFSIGLISLSVGGSFDIEELITSCSGLLCRAAKAMQQRNHAYDEQLRNIMGN